MESLEIDDDIKAFLVESYENLNEIERDIIDLEKAPAGSEILVRIYRTLHTIKGNCGFLPFSKLESVAHAGENLLGCLRDRKLVVNPEIANALLQTVDSIRQMLNNIEAGGNEGDRDYSTLINTLQQLQQKQEGDKETGVGRQVWATGVEIQGNLPPSPHPPLSPSSPLPDIRVNIELLDRLMNLVGELVLARNQILLFSNTLEDTAFTATCQHLNLITSELQEGVMKTRMQPISIIWQKFPRVIRDLALAWGKQIRVEMEGTETELDKSIIEAIKDPLTHLIRNCIDHGIETPTTRIACGKQAEGKLFLRAFHESGKVNIQISDDGCGIDTEKLKQKAHKLGLINSTQVVEMSESEVMNLIFLPGLSTAEQVTNLSGRGVGMDVVRTNIEKINGTVDIFSQLGQGTTFQIKIPLTLAIISALIIASGGNSYAIPQASIQELVRLEGEQVIGSIETLYNVPVLRLRGNILPLIYLNRELQIEEKATEEKTVDETIYIVVIQTEDYRFGLIVDVIDDTQDIVVKPLGKQLKNLTIFAGATILGDGKVALIIDAIALANYVGITPLLQKRLSANTTIKAQDEDNRQMMLLFQGPFSARMGIPMAIVSRLEEIKSSAVEKAGNQYVVQYRGKILSLIDLHAVFGDTQAQFANLIPQFYSQLEKEEEETIQVVVVTLNQENSIGLVVDRIIDIVEESITITGAAGRPGVLYLAVIQGEVTEILDIENVIRLANPHLKVRS
ncbi:MAG: chemotaxis protein CheW [Heteroscytonema crispum UTEX LB 1556]